MTAGLRVLSAGPGVTLQDAGRRGLLRFGVTPAGPMDEGAYAAAVTAAGAAAAIEISLGGVEVTAEGATIGVAIAGGAFDIRRDGAALPAACALALEPGARLSVRAGAGGAFAYLAPFGRFDLAPVLGSLATHLRARLGPLNGRGLQAGDFLPLADLTAPPAQPLQLLAPWLERPPAPLRALPGPQDDYFSPEMLELFFSAEWRLSARCDRMAFRLDGPRVTHAKGHDIVSDGIARGAVQIPGDGAPLVLMADRQPTGGYPKIAHVISADLDALAQLRPGATLRFARVAHAEAVAARAERARRLAAGPTLSPAIRNLFDFAFLSSANLVDGFIAPRHDEA